jgi:L-fucose isomerase-like protein
MTTTKLIPRVAVAALASPLEVGADHAPDAASALSRVLTAAGCEVLALGPVTKPARAVEAGRLAAEWHADAVAFVAASWFEDYLVLDFLEECDAPLLLWPLPGMETGALCGTQQLTAFLHRLETPYACVFGKADDGACLARALTFLRGAALKGILRRARIGIAGHRVNGMTHTAPDEMSLKKNIGPRVMWLEAERLLKRAGEMPEADARAWWQRVKDRAGSCDSTERDGIDAMRVYAALRESVDLNGLTGLTIGCYPDLMGRVCLAASLLADEGIVMACEGDAHGAIGQIMLQRLTGQPTHNADWLDPVDGESVVFTHCGSGSFSLAEKPKSVRLAPVRLMSQGVCALFTAKPGPVTLVNITGMAGGYRVGLLEGEAIPTEMVFPGNPVRVRFQQPVSRLIDWIHETGLGHHWMIGYGHVGAEIRAWARLCGPGLRLSEPG